MAGPDMPDRRGPEIGLGGQQKVNGALRITGVLGRVSTGLPTWVGLVGSASTDCANEHADRDPGLKRPRRVNAGVTV